MLHFIAVPSVEFLQTKESIPWTIYICKHEFEAGALVPELDDVTYILDFIFNFIEIFKLESIYLQV